MMTFLFLLYSIFYPYSDKPVLPAYPAIHITVINVNSKKGEILLALYNSDKGFPGKRDGAIRFAKAAAQKGKVQIVIDDVPPGTYAIAVFHDTNGDKKLNTNMLGIPKEDYGFSNNARNTFSAPSFRQAAFVHNGVTNLEIQLR